MDSYEPHQCAFYARRSYGSVDGYRNDRLGRNYPINYTNTGGKYNPTTDSWTATNTTNAPTGRYAHTAVWTGSEMIVWGGYHGINSLNTGGKYNPGTEAGQPSALRTPQPRETRTQQ